MVASFILEVDPPSPEITHHALQHTLALLSGQKVITGSSGFPPMPYICSVLTKHLCYPHHTLFLDP